MQGFKNLLPRNLLTDDSVQPLVKKTQEHRKTTQLELQHILAIYKNIEMFAQSFEGDIFELHHELTETENKLPLFFIELTQLFKNINVEVKIFSEKSNGSYKQLNNVCNSLFLQYTNQVLNFQQQIRNYQSMEQIVFQMSKKYGRTFKSMLSYLDSYKSSFTDARLIYNTEQKIKRYQLCEATFKSLQEQLKSIQQKTQKLTQKKTFIRQNFISIENQMKRTLKIVASKSITEVKNFVKNFSDFQKTVVTFLAQKKFKLQNISISSFFQSLPNTKFPEYFNCQIDPEQCKILPALFVYIEYLKSEYIPYCKSAFINYLKQTSQRLQKRKQINKQLLQFLRLYAQMIEKYQYNNLKQSVSNFQKLKKRLSELFSSRFVSFLKSIHSIFDLSIGINEKLLKSFSNKLKQIQSSVMEQNKQMDLFLKQLRSNVQKFIGPKKQRKVSSSQSSIIRQTRQESLYKSTDGNRNMVMEDSIIVVDNTQFRKQIKERAQFLAHLIQGFVSKLEGTQKVLKSSISSMINDYSESSNQFYSLCCEYETIYFGSQQFITNFKKYETDIDKTLQKQVGLMTAELGFRCLIEQQESNRAIVFDGQISKVQEFKKLKKPQGLQNIGDLKTKKSSQEGQIQRKTSNESSDLTPSINEQQNGQKTPPQLLAKNKQASSKEILSSSATIGTVTNINTNNQGNSNSSNTNTSKQLPNTNNPATQVVGINSSTENSTKYFELLSKKITFLQGEQYIKSFSCAFYDKIILQGRIFITNNRLCFNSKFNPKNLFFGGTFIEIPKKDIIKVEKRYNALIFDNSIAVTTVNGEMFFTSFFARDQAFQLINKALQINIQQQFFQPQLQQQQAQGKDDSPVQQQQIQQQDDLKKQDEIKRQQQVQRMLEKFPYQVITEGEYEVPRITAMKFFRLFDSGQEIHMNRRAYKSFLQYCKDLVGHKEIEVHHFKPNILQYLNISNIKSNTPTKIQRKLNAMVPISAAGVPFMPKAARSDQTQALYFISKNKYIIESTIQNSGAPYTDCFNVKLKRTIQSFEENKIRFRVEMYVNFAKSTMMKSMIESKANEETKAYFVKMMEEIRKYFKGLEKVKKPIGKVNKDGKQENGVSGQQLQGLRKQLQATLQEKDKLQERVKVLQSGQSQFKQYLFVSVILNVFLLLLLVN